MNVAPAYLIHEGDPLHPAAHLQPARHCDRLKMALFRQRRRGLGGAMDKMRGATRRFVQFCDNTIGVRDDDGGKTVMRELRRFLTRDMPRYFRGLPLPYSYADAQRLTLREWLYLSPLLLALLIIAQRSLYALLGIVFLILLVNA